MVKKKAKKRTTKPEWYQTRPVYVASVIGSLLLSYKAALLAIDTASMFAYTAALIFAVLAVRHATLLVRSFVKR